MNAAVVAIELLVGVFVSSDLPAYICPGIVRPERAREMVEEKLKLTLDEGPSLRLLQRRIVTPRVVNSDDTRQLVCFLSKPVHVALVHHPDNGVDVGLHFEGGFTFRVEVVQCGSRDVKVLPYQATRLRDESIEPRSVS